jgi:peptidyl-dipeptidase A
MRWGPAALGVVVMGLYCGGSSDGSDPGAPAGNDARAARFLQQYNATVRPVEIEVALWWWNANTSGRDDDFRKKQETETRLDALLSDPKAFAELKAIRGGRISDRLLARQIEILHLGYLAKQVDPKLLAAMLEKSNAVEKAFNVYRPKVDGQELSENKIREILQQSRDSRKRRAVWESGKAVGPIVEPRLKELVKLRNQAARKLGFSDYHVMQLQLGEQKQDDVLRLFDELDRLTREPFRKAKAEIDAVLAKHCGVAVDDLRSWHYHDPFFQESPAVFGGDTEAIYRKVDILKACREFYAGIDMPVDDVLRRSDLYEKPGKSPHAFCTDIDRAGDVRVLANVAPGHYWLGTMLHELGHGVYSSKNIPSSLPYVLRTDAHPLSTEGVAMMFERVADNAASLKAMGVSVPSPEEFNAAAARLRRNRLLIFSRWCQVMFRFEKALYANPDADLNRLWWDLVEKYQEVHRPDARNAPDYAAKIHIVSAPAYYHNYMMGELFASQVHRAIAEKALGGVDPSQAVYVGRKEVGRFMKDRVFAPGRTLNWNELTRFATGEPLSAKAFAAEIAAPGGR